jgi:plastocyanin
MKKHTCLFLLCVFLLSLTAQAEEPDIAIHNYAFVPAQITVLAGTKVKWINKDEVPHTVVGVNNMFRSSALDTNDAYSYLFRKPGKYTYFCTLHPTMTGTIIVKEKK